MEEKREIRVMAAFVKLKKEIMHYVLVNPRDFICRSLFGPLF